MTIFFMTVTVWRNQNGRWTLREKENVSLTSLYSKYTANACYEDKEYVQLPFSRQWLAWISEWLEMKKCWHPGQNGHISCELIRLKSWMANERWRELLVTQSVTVTGLKIWVAFVSWRRNLITSSWPSCCTSPFCSSIFLLHTSEHGATPSAPSVRAGTFVFPICHQFRNAGSSLCLVLRLYPSTSLLVFSRH